MEISSNIKYGADEGEPDTGFIRGGKKRKLGTLAGKPEPWYERGGYKQPTAYDISGSQNWFNKADNAITIHRHRSLDDDYVGVHVHKIRFQYKNGKPTTGSEPAKLNYNVRTGNYETYIPRVKEDIFKENRKNKTNDTKDTLFA